MNDANTNWTRHLIRQRLEDLRRAGVRQLPRARPATVARTAEVAGAQSTSAAQPAARSKPESLVETPHNSELDTMSSDKIELAKQSTEPAAARAERDEQLQLVNEQVKQCQRCDELCSTRTQTVFGVGNSTARLCFLGEAPGADEDRQGEPFVGRAGQLLNKIIEACTLRREDVYILNTLKCRPPGNRNPLPEEAANCAEYFLQQIDIIQPEFICCLGAVAASNLLDTKESIGRLRGRFHTWRGIQVLATYHPAYLLRNPSAKAEVWKDMQFLMAAMGIEIP
jgi:DNA polymerase